MSTSGFTSPFGANSNPFGPPDERRAPLSVIQPVIEEEETDAVTSPTTPSFGNQNAVFRGPFGGVDGSNDGPPPTARPPNPEGYPAQYNFARRTSVSAESLKPVADSYDNWNPPVHPKSQEQLERLKKAIEGNFLFSHLDDEQSSQILGALVEKPIPAKDIKVGTSIYHVSSISDLIELTRALSSR
jgi:cAMP-dependent protein kinase regulator